MRKLSYAALTAAVFFSRAATAHEFVCEETINGEVVHEIKNYPQKLSFTVRVINTHPTDASTALSVRDDLMSSLGVSFTPAAPFTVAAGAAAEFRFEITVHDDAECLALSRVQACATGFEDLFEVTWDSGAALVIAVAETTTAAMITAEAGITMAATMTGAASAERGETDEPVDDQRADGGLPVRGGLRRRRSASGEHLAGRHWPGRWH